MIRPHTVILLLSPSMTMKQLLQNSHTYSKRLADPRPLCSLSDLARGATEEIEQSALHDTNGGRVFHGGIRSPDLAASCITEEFSRLPAPFPEYFGPRGEQRCIAPVVVRVRCAARTSPEPMGTLAAKSATRSTQQLKEAPKLPCALASQSASGTVDYMSC